MGFAAGGVGVIDISRVLIDDVLYPVKSARVRATASGNTQILAAVSGKRIKILSYNVGPVSAAVTVTFQDAAGTPVVMAGPFDCAANGGTNEGVLKENDELGTSNTATNVNLSGTANVTARIHYVEV